MAEPKLPPSYRGKGRNTPQEHIRFEYRIDRKHRVLRRQDMFSNSFHPSKLEPTEDFFVCNSMHSHNLRAGLVAIMPGVSFDFPDYPNEHLLAHLSGDLRWSIAGEDFYPRRGDQLFTPAFTPYKVTNTGTSQSWFFSGYARVDLWLGRPPAETAIAAGSEGHRFMPVMQGPPSRKGDGWEEWDALAGSRNHSKILRLAPGASLPPHHRQTEQILLVLTGASTWRVDGQEVVMAPEDCLFIPAMMPFSVRNETVEPALIIGYDVALAGE